ncbi:uncharacterized protein DS421_10g291970 [Arachis hypogaea]|nr:uncharacterized protein DS421_10g291970 [Arachis hypogaea]
MEAMIPVEIEEGSPRVIHYNEEANSQLQREELDLLPEIQESNAPSFLLATDSK